MGTSTTAHGARGSARGAAFAAQSRRAAQLVLLGTLVGVCAAAQASSSLPGAAAEVEEEVLAGWNGEIHQVLAPGALQPIYMPRAVGAAEARLAAGEPVIGVTINGESRAYAIYLLNSHEVVNDVLGGEPIAVVWCPLADLAVVYSRRLDEGEHVFEASGALLKNTVVLTDYETNSLWEVVTGFALRGPRRGRQLLDLPSTWKTSWNAWRAAHPQTTVARYSGIESPGRDSYAGYHRSPLRIGIDPVRHRDDRLRAKTVVLGLNGTDRPRAYPLALFDRIVAFPDVYDDEPILVYGDRKGGSFAVFSRVVEDRPSGAEIEIDFDAVPNARVGREAPATARDRTTGTLWDLRTGAAISGALAGAHLEPFPHRMLYWFVWADYFPRTTVADDPIR